jgi:uncharacterized protein (DUF305 family)
MRAQRAVVVALALVASGFAPARAADHMQHPPAHKSAAAETPFARGVDAGMAKMMADMHAPGYTGNVDADFLAMMIPHHQGAIEMARLLLIHGRDPVTRKLAEDIIASQQVEIEGMRRRLEQLRKGASVSEPEGFPALGGTRGTTGR